MGNRRSPIQRRSPAGHQLKGITRPIPDHNLTLGYELETWRLAGCRHDQQQALLRWWDLKRISVPFDCLQRSLGHGRICYLMLMRQGSDDTGARLGPVLTLLLQPSSVFSFALVRHRDLLALPFGFLLSGCDRLHPLGKSSVPSPLAASLKVHGNATHNNSRFFGDLTSLITKQLPGVVRMAMGATVLGIRIKQIFHRCWNPITPWLALASPDTRPRKTISTELANSAR